MPAKFISEEWFKQNSIMPFNLDSEKVYPFYKKSQDIHIRTILGDALYFRLYNKTIENLNDDDKNLLNNISQCLCAYIVYEYVKLNIVKINNKGIVQDEDTATDVNIEKTLGILRIEAQFYAERLKKFVCNNTDKYPEYLESNSDINPQKKVSGYGFSNGSLSCDCNDCECK